MAKSSDQSSIASSRSSLSQKAITAVKKGTKAVFRPLKKIKKAVSSLSSRSSAHSTSIPTTRNTSSRSSTRSMAPSIATNSTSSRMDIDQSGDASTDIVENESDVEPDVDPEKDLEALKRAWRSPIYSFFKPDVSVQYHEDRLCHFFKCAACKCKSSTGGVRRFQDSKDKSSTANLKHHAIKCFGEEAVESATKGIKAKASSGSIFAMFARNGQQPVQYSHRSHSNAEVRARLVKWVTENNRPVNIINDRDLQDLLTAGRPHIELPSRWTLQRDIKACFEKSRERIAKLLRDHPGRLHFATDAWTSPNHRAFVAWTVHFEFQGEMLAFLLDVIEVPVSHTGAALAAAFQDMLVRFGLENKILAMNADNASSNNTQTSKLATLNNSFDEVNRVRCFNHTLQLSANELIRPFNAGMTKRDAADSILTDDTMPDLEEFEDESDESGEGDSGSDGQDESVDIEDIVGSDDDVAEFDELGAHDQEQLLADTAVVRTTVSKIRNLLFAIIHSTTIALPAWQQACSKSKLKPCLIPRDVVTRWNSTYDMLSFVLKYRNPIDSVTADKSLKLRKYELDNDDWKIVDDLVTVLERYKKATLFFSRDSASIAAVIPAMDRLNSGLHPQSKQSFHVSILSAMKLARKKLDRYYVLTDDSSPYRIAMVLHPGLKLEYFRQQNWPEEWIDTAENIVREEYIDKYEQPSTVPVAESPDKDGSDKLFADFGDISVGNSIVTQVNEIDAYLRQPVENVKEPLKWWFANRQTYPNLYRMASDYLSIPGVVNQSCFNETTHIH